MSRRDLILKTAPPAPPCFGARDIWIEWCTSAAEAQSERGQPKLLILEAGKPARFNYVINFCADCAPFHQREKMALGLCKPGWLAQFDPANKTAHDTETEESAA